jgi:DNA-binding transcriptional regulator YhcF (GntR family)
VLEHILTTTNLTSTEKLYYILADSLALIGKNKGYSRSCALPSEDWAKYLGCSRSLVFTMQKSLEQKGYFIINKDFDHIGRNKRNLITPTLPPRIFNNLNEKFPDRVGDHHPYYPLSECKRSYLDRTKLFIKLNYNLLKIITTNRYLNPMQKILWLSFYSRCYKNHMLQVKDDFKVDKYNYDYSSFYFISSYKEIAEQHSCNTKHLSKSLKSLEDVGFIKTQNIYVRKKSSDNTYKKIQERQDESLWKITVSLPEDCISELEKVKDRSNLILGDIKATADTETFRPNLVENFLILGGVKFNLNPEQSDFLKSLITCDSNDNGSDINYKGSVVPISPIPHTPSDESCTDSITEELSINDRGDGEDELEEFSSVNDSKFLPDVPKTLMTSSSLENIGKKEDRNYGIKSDPTFAKSGLLFNKDSLLKIKDLKSNLRAKPKVIFNNFLKKFKIEDNIDNTPSSKQKANNYKNHKFNICSELIRNKLKELSKDKADKARKFAYSLLSKKLAKGYAASLSKGELAKQLIHHAATWKPTKLGAISREQEIDTALSVAWKSIIAGTWQPPLEWAKAEVLNYEYLLYLKKYQESGIMSYEVKTLEIEVDKLLGGCCDLEGKIKSSVISEFDYNKKSDEELCKPDDYSLIQDNDQNWKYITGENQTSAVNTNKNEDLQELSNGFYSSHQIQDQLLYFSKDIIYKDMLSKSDYCNNTFETELAEDAKGESNIIHSVDLSNLSDSQKHIVLHGTDTEIMEITTASNIQYFGRLKTMEVNDSGELVMTLVPEIGKEFIESKNRMLLTGGIAGLGIDFDKNRLTQDLSDVTGSCKNDIRQMQEKSWGFTGIDKALAGILNNLSCNYDDK